MIHHHLLNNFPPTSITQTKTLLINLSNTSNHQDSFNFLSRSQLPYTVYHQSKNVRFHIIDNDQDVNPTLLGTNSVDRANKYSSVKEQSQPEPSIPYTPQGDDMPVIPWRPRSTVGMTWIVGAGKEDLSWEIGEVFGVDGLGLIVWWGGRRGSRNFIVVGMDMEVIWRSNFPRALGRVEEFIYPEWMYWNRRERLPRPQLE